uniref:PC3-like endoprotease variant B n=1 Tax=Callorhinchus milii TaxID=7868 RepID=A0A4W3JT29_CALMI
SGEKSHGLCSSCNSLHGSSRHGTKCAGEVAMQANNSFCGVGIAFNARIGGIRILDGKVTDALEAAALSYNNNYIDIYTCCWGPNDNGMVFDGPRNLTTKALKEGAEKVRDLEMDPCFVFLLNAVAIGGRAFSLSAPTLWNSIPHSLSLAPSLASFKVTTELDGKCTNTFKGTSSAAPMAAAVIALVLQANPDLTWRDVQHLIVRTCKVCDPMDEDWSINGAGYHVHHKYGFGMLDAGRLVKKALRWTNVGPQRQCVVDFHAGQTRIITCCLMNHNHFAVLIHLQVTVSLSSICRGDLSIFLTSPYGTVSQLLGIREADNSKEGLTNWTFTTVHSWGEDPKGTWKLTVSNFSLCLGIVRMRIL